MISKWQSPPSWIFALCEFWQEICLQDSIFNLCFKFSANAGKNGQVMAKNMIFNMAVAAISDFVGYGFWGLTLSRDLILGVCVKLGANQFKYAALWPFNDFKMAAAAILNLLPVSIFSIWSLWIVAGDVPVKFRVCTWIYGWVIKLCPKKTKWRPPPSWIAIS